MTLQIVLDTETTGLETTEGNRVIEIGCVELRNRRVTGEQRWYLNPDRDSEPGALAVHGISRAFLADKPRFAQVADELINRLRGAELIIHNAAFDVGFLDYELALAGREERIGSLCSVLDTVALSRRVNPGQKASLDALCKRYSVDNSHRTQHGALLDARLLAEVYLAMTGGQSALGLDHARDDKGNAPQHGALAELFAASAEPLIVVRANPLERGAHEARIEAIGKKSGRWLWPDGDRPGAARPIEPDQFLRASAVTTSK